MTPIEQLRLALATATKKICAAMIMHPKVYYFYQKEVKNKLKKLYREDKKVRKTLGGRMPNAKDRRKRLEF